MHFFERVNSRTELPPTLGNGSLVNTLGRVLKSDGAQEVSSIDGDSDSKKEVDEEDDATEIENAKRKSWKDLLESLLKASEPGMKRITTTHTDLFSTRPGLSPIFGPIFEPEVVHPCFPDLFRFLIGIFMGGRW